MSHRVITGSAKGRRLKLVPGGSTRPVMDRVKESLFNIIGRDIYDCTFLDLFAGTGAVGIEALSRGAAFALFVDMERIAIKTVEENLQTTQLSDRARVLRADALAMLARPPQEIFDFIYVAPPQYAGMWKQTLEALEANPAWIPEGTEVIVQIDPKEKEPITLKCLEETDERRYGNTLLWFFTAQAPQDDDNDDNTEDKPDDAKTSGS